MSFAIPSGTGNVAANPELDAGYRPTALSPASVTTGGVTVPGAAYDADGVERIDPVSIGAFQAPPPS